MMTEERLKILELLHTDIKGLMDDLFKVYTSDPSAYNNFEYLDFLASHLRLAAQLSHNFSFLESYKFKELMEGNDSKTTPNESVNNVVELFKKE